MQVPVLRSVEVGRYAPSPTGRLHLGNIWAALAAHDDIRERNGIFILRIEDTDLPRNVAGAESTIIQDLDWIGISWDEGPDNGGPAAPYRQSERNAIYRDALVQLAREGLIYPCTCSRKELQSGASAPHGPDGVAYPGYCRRELTGPQAVAMVDSFLKTPGTDRGAALRIRTDSLRPVEFDDEVHGRQHFDFGRDSGDFVVLRRDGLWAYQFVCAVDDALMGITRVVRGSDLLSSTARQVAIMNLLRFSPPVYRHIPLLLDADGSRMSKRDGSMSLALLMEQGLSPADVHEKLAEWVKK